jgi:hypothetical protein
VDVLVPKKLNKAQRAAVEALARVSDAAPRERLGVDAQ